MRIFFSAGEPSGDQHAAHLIQELKARHGDFQAEGFGGPHMRDEGCDLHFELTTMAVMGVARVLPLVFKFRKLVIQAEEHFEKNPPDAVVLVDFPGFNWWIAKAAKAQGIPVYYYMPPQLWAWGAYRIKRIRKWVDHVICSLPFEFEWYKRRNVKASWVGHPFFDEVATRQMDESLVTELRNREEGQRVIAILPGSRDHEVTKNFPVMLEVIRKVSAAVPNVRWIVGGYREKQTALCRQLQAESGVDADMTYFVDKTSEVIEASDCCFMVSGSISLELLARSKPGVVLYRLGRVAKVLKPVVVPCKFVTLTNLIADKELMPEFVSAFNPKNDILAITEILQNWCLDETVLPKLKAEMSELAKGVAITGATARTADLLLNELLPEGSQEKDANRAA